MNENTSTNRFDNATTAVLGSSVNEAHMSVVSVNDCSSSVEDVMEQMNRGRVHFKQKVCESAKAGELVDIAMVNFASEVEVMPLRKMAYGQEADPLDEIDAAFVPMKDLPNEALALEAHGLTRLNDGVVRGLKLVREHTKRRQQLGMQVKRSLVLIYSDGQDEPNGCVDEAAQLISQMVEKNLVKVIFLGFGDYDREAAKKLTASCGGYFEASYDASDGIPFARFFHFFSEITCGMSTLAPGSAIPVSLDSNDDDIHFISTDGVTTFEDFCK